jgi:DNA-binding response OmpR family regulator
MGDSGTKSATGSGGGKARTKPTILVADDDVEILSLVTRNLRRMDATILEASDGEEALKIARREKPDLVVLDVMMPGMSGWEVCRAIREDSGLSETKVIMLTGIGERLNEMTSPLYGADEHLDKPFDFDVLQKLVEEVLNRPPTPRG